jgi:trehalose utilization protein
MKGEPQVQAAPDDPGVAAIQRLCLALGMSFTRIVAMALLLTFGAVAAPVRVLVWDEQQPQQKTVYDDFIGGEIAARLSGKPGFEVRRANLDDPGQGVTAEALDETDVLIWWGHVRNGEISPETGDAIAARIAAGKLSLIALHSAHWSAPFMSSMNAIARQNARNLLALSDRATAVIHETPLFANLRTPPGYGERLSPSALFRKPFEGPAEIILTLPNCCFPACRGDGKPSLVRVLLPDHPIAKGLPAKFNVEHTEMYNEPFHVPPPDEVVLEERWESGEWFRSGSVWKLGKGRIFYFRPGHETYAVYKNQQVQQVIENAVRWLGHGGK